jgi:hypothetical protein
VLAYKEGAHDEGYDAQENADRGIRQHRWPDPWRWSYGRCAQGASNRRQAPARKEALVKELGAIDRQLRASRRQIRKFADAVARLAVLPGLIK